MKVEHGNHTCEHCGAKVSASPVCPCCGRDHSAMWVATAKKGDAASGFAMFFAVPYFIIFEASGVLWSRSIDQFVNGLAYALLNTFIVGVVAGIIFMMITGAKPTDKDIKRATKRG